MKPRRKRRGVREPGEKDEGKSSDMKKKHNPTKQLKLSVKKKNPRKKTCGEGNHESHWSEHSQTLVTRKEANRNLKKILDLQTTRNHETENRWLEEPLKNSALPCSHDPGKKTQTRLERATGVFQRQSGRDKEGNASHQKELFRKLFIALSEEKKRSPKHSKRLLGNNQDKHWK